MKVVVQAIPTYSMSCFKLPITVCHEIEAMIRKFWWGQRGTRRRIHWVKWSKMCRPKSLGYMGFRESKSLMMLCLASKFGAYYKTKILYSSSSSKKKFSHMGPFLMLRKIKGLLLGEAF